MAVIAGIVKIYACVRSESVAKQRRMFSFDFLTHVVAHVFSFCCKYKGVVSCKSKRNAHSLSQSNGNEKHQVTLSFREGGPLFCGYKTFFLLSVSILNPYKMEASSKLKAECVGCLQAIFFHSTYDTLGEYQKCPFQ